MIAGTRSATHPAGAAALAALVALAPACDGGAGGGSLESGPTQAVEHPPALATPPCPPGPPPTSFVTRDGNALVLDGGRFRAVGANVYYLQQMLTYGQGNPVATDEALQALDRLVCVGASVVRTWAFNDTTDSSGIRPQPGMYRETALQGLDRAVAEARARGLRVILTLVNN